MCECLCVCMDAVYTRAPLIAIIVFSRSRSDILRGTNLCLSGSSARPFHHWLWSGVINMASPLIVKKSRERKRLI